MVAFFSLRLHFNLKFKPIKQTNKQQQKQLTTEEMWNVGNVSCYTVHKHFFCLIWKELCLTAHNCLTWLDQSRQPWWAPNCLTWLDQSQQPWWQCSLRPGSCGQQGRGGWTCDSPGMPSPDTPGCRSPAVWPPAGTIALCGAAGSCLKHLQGRRLALYISVANQNTL